MRLIFVLGIVVFITVVLAAHLPSLKNTTATTNAGYD